jgi:signal transduction histidine kinase
MSSSACNPNYGCSPAKHRRPFDLGDASRLRALVSWLRTPAKLSEVQQREQVLARARLALSIGWLAAIYLEPNSLGPYGVLASTLFWAYSVHSALFLVVLRFHSTCDSALRLAVHAADIFCAVLIFWLAGSPTSVVLLQDLGFVFALFAAAYRWGRRGIVATVNTCAVLLLTEELIWEYFGRESRLIPLLIQGLSLIVIAHLLGHLGEKEIRLRTRTSLIDGLAERAHSEVGLRETLQVVLTALLDLFEADRAALAIRQAGKDQAFLWEIERSGANTTNPVQLSELEPFQQQRYFFPSPGQTFYAAKEEPRHREESFRVVVEGNENEGRLNATCTFPDYFLTWHGFRSLLATSFTLKEEWSGRVFLFNPRGGARRRAELCFFRDLVAEVAPAVHNLYRLRRVRARAGALERARIARELHDGVIQTLIALEMQISVLRQSSNTDRFRMAEDLNRIQGYLRQEILNVRDLIQRIRPPETCEVDLLHSLASTVERFHRETVIRATFVSDIEKAAVAPPLAREVSRIVQEALVNIRKHSQAQNVLVRLSAAGDLWKLTIEDDGCGFDFAGRLSQEELDEAHCGPAIIKERVRSLAGQLTIESAPGRGARLEITLPYHAHGQEHSVYSYSDR